MAANLQHIFADIRDAAQFVATNALPGWKESNYEAALVGEINATRGMHMTVQQQVTLPSYFKTSTGTAIETGALRPDLRVECRCIDCEQLPETDLCKRICYVEIKLEPKGTLQTAHIDQARGYAAAASGWAKCNIACFALAFTGRGNIVVDAFAGIAGHSVRELLD